jgi:hypothetical protein
VRSERYRISTAVAGATAALIVVLGIHPLSTSRIVAGYVLVLAAIALASLLRQLAAGGDFPPASDLERELARTPEEPGRPPELVRVERELTLGMANAGHLHTRLIPLLRDAALARLGGRLSQDRVGTETWELLRPDRPAPADRTDPGISLRRLRAVVDELELL